MTRYIISITAQDRSGIVAAVSRALFDLSGNIEAASQTVHQGYFAMIMLCAFEQASQPDEISRKINAQADTDLHVYVTQYQLPVTQEQTSETETFIVTTVGADKPGILQAVSEYLGAQQINIDDLYCCVQAGEFVLICEVSVPQGQDVEWLQAGLEEVGRQRGFTTHMQHENIFVATNELRFKRFGPAR